MDNCFGLVKIFSQYSHFKGPFDDDVFGAVVTFLGLTWERVSRVVTGGFDAGFFLLSEFLFLER